jgi:hypothetical protein
MGLETGTHINDLVATNPVSGDTKSQGDDHLRLIKAILQNTFPTAAKAFYFPDFSTKTANYTILNADENKHFLGDATAGSITLTLPTLAVSRAGYKIFVTKIDSSTNAVVVGGTINGVTNYSLTNQYDSIELSWSGAAWYAVGRRDPFRVVSKTANATLARTEMYGLVKVSTTSGDVTIIPNTTPVLGEWVWIMKTTVSNNLIINPTSTVEIDGATTYTLEDQYEAVLIVWDGTQWLIASHKVDVVIPTIPAHPAGSVTNLLIEPGSVPNSRIDISCDECVLSNTANETVRHDDVDVTLNFATTGANGLDTGTVAANTPYFIWLISNGTTVAAIAKASAASTPTLPSGYTYRKLVGWVRTGSGAVLYQSKQRGADFGYLINDGGLQPIRPPQLAAGAAGTFSLTSPTLDAVSWADYGPVDASLIRIGVASFAGAPSSVLAAPSIDYGGSQNGPSGSNGLVWPVYIDSNAAMSISVEFVPKNSNIAWASSGGGARLVFHGFRVPWV